MYIHPCMHTYIHIYIHTYIHAVCWLADGPLHGQIQVKQVLKKAYIPAHFSIFTLFQVLLLKSHFSIDTFSISTSIFTLFCAYSCIDDAFVRTDAQFSPFFKIAVCKYVWLVKIFASIAHRT